MKVELTVGEEHDKPLCKRCGYGFERIFKINRENSCVGYLTGDESKEILKQVVEEVEQ